MADTTRGADMDGPAIFERYCQSNEIMPSNVPLMARYIRAMSTTYPQDTDDADAIAERLRDWFMSRVEVVRTHALRRPWTWLRYRQQFEQWPWEPAK